MMKGNGIFAVILQIGGDRMMLEGAGKETLTCEHQMRYLVYHKKKNFFLWPTHIACKLTVGSHKVNKSFVK